MLKGAICRFPNDERNISLQQSLYYSHIALSCVNSLTILLNLFANGFVVYRYYRTRARQPVSSTLIFLLASFDFLQGVLAQPLYTSVYMLELFGILNCSLDNAADVVECIFLGFSFIMAAFVLSSERLAAIIYPIHHRVHMRRKGLIYVSLTLFAVWTMLVIILHIILTPVQLFFITVFLMSSGLIYTTAVYVKIFRVSRETARIRSRNCFAMENHGLSTNGNKGDFRIEKNSEFVSGENTSKAYDVTSHANGGPGRQLDGTPRLKALTKAQNATQRFNLTTKEKKTIYRMLCIVGVLYLMSIPLLSAFTSFLFGVSEKLFVNYLYPWAVTILFANGVINPYIYCYRNEHFRRGKARL